MFLEMDQELFQECQRKYQEDEAKAKGMEEVREQTWKRLEAAGRQSSNSSSDNALASSNDVPIVRTVAKGTSGTGTPIAAQGAAPMLGK